MMTKAVFDLWYCIMMSDSSTMRGSTVSRWSRQKAAPFSIMK